MKKALQLSGDNNVDRSSLVTSTLYFEGDYSATCDYIESLKSQPQEYKLFDNNCVQQSVMALQKSEKYLQGHLRQFLMLLINWQQLYGLLKRH